MIRLLGSIPRRVTVACSGGVDSMVALDFLSKNHTVDVAFFDHGTEHSALAKKFVMDQCNRRRLKLHVGKITDKNPARGVSLEEHWREERYNFLKTFDTVVTAHHLDDVVETWIWSSLHGSSSLIPYNRGNVIRPFLLNTKHELEEWARRKSVEFIQDESNNDLHHIRNYIRHKLVPHALVINPGIRTMIKKKLIARQK